MLQRFFPDIYIKSIYELPLETLKKRGINVLFFDIDNTIVPFDIPEPGERESKFLKNLISNGFRVCFLSNNSKSRVERFNKDIGGHAVAKADKPGTKKLLSMLKKFNASPENAAMIGDQVFTDVWCAHRAGILAIYVKPVSERDQFVTKIKRGLEKSVLKRYFIKVGENKSV